MRLSPIAIALLAALLVGAMSGPTHVPKKLTRAELEALARDVGFPDPAYAATIAMRESGGNPYAVNNAPPREISAGLWQINTLAWRKWTVQELLDPRRNAEAAFEISRRGTDWSAWSTHKRGEGPRVKDI